MSLLSLFCLSHQFLWLGLLGILLIRICFCQSKGLLCCCLIAVLSFSLRIYGWQKDYQAALKMCGSYPTQHFLIKADELKVAGNLASGNALWLDHHQRVKLTLFLTTKQQQKYLKNIKQSFIIETDATISKVKGPSNENEFDYHKYCQSLNYFLTAFANQFDLKKVTLVTGPSLYLHNLRRHLQLYLAQKPQPLSWYALTLFLGIKDETDLADSVAKLGLLYLFCLSGMHVFYVRSFLLEITSKLGLTYELGQELNLVILPLFLVLGGSSPSLTRAVIMVWLGIFCEQICHVKIRLISLWSWTLIGNLWIKPALLYGVGPQLSYLLTLTIILSQEKNIMIQSLELNLFSLPIILYHSFQWNIWTGVLSIAIMPLFKFLVLPATLCGAFFAHTTAINNWLLNLFTGILNLCASLPGEITFGKPPLGFVVMVLGETLLACETRFRSRKLCWLLISCYAGMFLYIHTPLTAEVVYFDIGQGDCTLIRSRFNRQVLIIDTGGKVSFNTQKWQQRTVQTSGQRIVANYLLSKGVDHIDTLYLTHQDQDHTGNFPSISQKIKIKKVVVPLGMEKLASFKAKLKQSAVKPSQVQGQTDQYQQAYPLTLLHPFAAGQGTNDDSLVLLADFYGIKCLFTGDLPQQGEKEVIKKYFKLKADIFKTGHHGSKTATAKEFVTQLQPKLAIISCGRHNRYGHPNQETLVTLKKTGVPYLITAKVGMIKLVKPLIGNLHITTYQQQHEQNYK